jgi:hypothetical protein
MEKRSKSPGKLVFLLILHIVPKSGGSEECWGSG